jgi:hypothetical protein
MECKIIFFMHSDVFIKIANLFLLSCALLCCPVTILYWNNKKTKSHQQHRCLSLVSVVCCQSSQRLITGLGDSYGVCCVCVSFRSFVKGQTMIGLRAEAQQEEKKEI